MVTSTERNILIDNNTPPRDLDHIFFTYVKKIHFYLIKINYKGDPIIKKNVTLYFIMLDNFTNIC